MNLATWFKRTPQDLIGPNLPKAPLRHFNLSGAQLSFRCPPQTAMIPGYFGPDTIDLDNDLEPQLRDPKNNYLRIFDSGWNFDDHAWWGESYGGVCLAVIAGKNNEQRGVNNSLFLMDALGQRCFRSNEISWGSWNKRIWEKRDNFVDEITPETAFWRYPKSFSDLQIQLLSDQKWIRYETYQPGEVPDIRFETALSHHHFVRLIFSPSAHGGLDFFSPEHNFKAASYRFIDDFMASVNIRLSPQAQQEYEEVQALYGADATV